MLHQIVLVGRIAKDPEIKETEKGKKVANILLAVPRSFKDVDGEYETDFLNCSLWDGVATNVTEYCKSGDLVGVKGRVSSNTYEKDGFKEMGSTHMDVLSIDGSNGCCFYRCFLLFLHSSLCLSLETLLWIEGLWRMYAAWL